MTAVLDHLADPPELAGLSVRLGWIGQPRLLRGVAEHDLTEHRAHQAVHGPLPAFDRDRLLGLLDAVALAGRGGAGFPLA
ncbi:MAG: hypothetical protein QOI26_2677, partial [Pseudonocardiales bacterium]|nr:hypothetical protein [Pseudonocardiales bacterium]